MPRAGGVQDARRVLTSDLLLVKPVGTDRWVQFRDVFEVDGKPVHDRSERLVKLFLEPTGSSARQVEQIAARARATTSAACSGRSTCRCWRC